MSLFLSFKWTMLSSAYISLFNEYYFNGINIVFLIISLSNITLYKSVNELQRTNTSMKMGKNSDNGEFLRDSDRI